MPKEKKKLCFVLMPFSKERKEVYTYGIKPACERAGFKSVRLDELTGVFNINRKIIAHIYNSYAIVADLTDKNPNVYYEMGVAHAIANKTIMIVQDTKDLPFDIRNYRCIQYKQSVDGLKKLEEHIVKCLESIDEWCKHPSNPVQDFKPHETFIPKAKFEELISELNQKSALLKESVPRSELKSIEKQLLEKEKVLSKSVKSTELTSLKKEKEQLQLDNDILKKENL